MDGAFKFAEKTAMATEASYPYKAKNGMCKKQFDVGIPKGGVVGYKDVKSNSVQDLMDAVAQQPVSVAIEADKQAFQLYNSGILSSPLCGHNLDHGVLLVGYGTDNGKAYWKVKNSWGASWGEKGFIRLARKVSDKSGECGLESQPSYPMVNGKPGPSPGPSPSPPSPPSPSTTHYEKPPCQDDEETVRIQGLTGSVCTPKCDAGSCPTDVPEGTEAKPQCILQSPTGDKYCALTCIVDEQCPEGASCGILGFTGICTYDSALVATSMQVQLSPESLLV